MQTEILGLLRRFRPMVAAQDPLSRLYSLHIVRLVVSMVVKRTRLAREGFVFGPRNRGAFVPVGLATGGLINQIQSKGKGGYFDQVMQSPIG